MKIGIVGSGRIGATLARRFVDVGHEVAIANSRGPQSLVELARETGAEAVEVGAVGVGSDVVVVAIPEGAVPDLEDGLLDAAGPEAAVVDTGNYYPERDGRIEAIEAGMTESGWVEEQLGRSVVKAFNTMTHTSLRDAGVPSGAPGRLALPVAGDEGSAKQLVMDLIDQIGFDPIDAGSLAESWRQQPETPVYGADLDAEATRRALAEASPERPPSMRAGE